MTIRNSQTLIVGLDPLESDVARLFAAADYPEGTLGWFQATAAAALDSGERAGLIVARDSKGVAVGALPLRVGRADSLVSRAAGLASLYTTRFSPPLGSPAIAGDLAGLLDKSDIDLLQLEAVDPDAVALRAFVDALRSAGWAVRWHRHFAEWSETVKDFDSYMAKRPRALIETLRRKRKRLERDHAVSIRFVDTGEHATAMVDAYARVHAASWKAAEPYPNFIPGLIESAAREGCLRASMLEVDGSPAAVQIWLSRGGDALLFKLVHRQELDAYSVGSVLTGITIEHLIRSDGVERISFGRGDDAYKGLWANRRRMALGVTAIRPRLMTLGHILRSVWGPNFWGVIRGAASDRQRLGQDESGRAPVQVDGK